MAASKAKASKQGCKRTISCPNPRAQQSREIHRQTDKKKYRKRDKSDRKEGRREMEVGRKSKESRNLCSLSPSLSPPNQVPASRKVTPRQSEPSFDLMRRPEPCILGLELLEFNNHWFLSSFILLSTFPTFTLHAW